MSYLARAKKKNPAAFMNLMHRATWMSEQGFPASTITHQMEIWARMIVNGVYEIEKVA